MDSRDHGLNQITPRTNPQRRADTLIDLARRATNDTHWDHDDDTDGEAVGEGESDGEGEGEGESDGEGAGAGRGGGSGFVKGSSRL
jgi:hypothetical protein